MIRAAWMKLASSRSKGTEDQRGDVADMESTEGMWSERSSAVAGQCRRAWAMSSGAVRHLGQVVECSGGVNQEVWAAR